METTLEPVAEVIHTARLELVPLPARLLETVLRGDLEAASDEAGAWVPRWLANDPIQLTQLQLAEHAARSEGFEGFGRLIILASEDGGRRVIGSIGFHGPPDDRGRLEVGSCIHPGHRGRGYALEAMAGLLDWATRRFGITRFSVAIQVRREPGELVPLEVATPASGLDEQLAGIAVLLEREGRCLRPSR
jgi:ribosomal-protein-alanine N-acetyltransferase